jgi:cupin 2 domain-containing protein
MIHPMITNLLSNLPNLNTKDEEFKTLFESKNIKIERIVSTGQSSPEEFWYEQAQDEWVMILEGEAVLSFEDDDMMMSKGDFVHIPAYKKHRVKSTKKDSHTIWLAIFFDL